MFKYRFEYHNLNKALNVMILFGFLLACDLYLATSLIRSVLYLKSEKKQIF